MLIEMGIGFISTLVATLIGVFIAFRLEQYAQSKKRDKTTLQHLRAIKKELKRNKSSIKANYNGIDHIQTEGLDSEHYALAVSSTSAWEAAQNDEIVERIGGPLYEDLQESYADIHDLNEMVKRLRTEALHPRLRMSSGDTGTEGKIGPDDWTLSVTYWDSDEGQAKEVGLGDLIKNRSNTLSVAIDGQIQQIDDEIDNLRKS